MLDTEGAGNYIGLNLSVTKLQPVSGLDSASRQLYGHKWQEWWGEGDDMM